MTIERLLRAAAVAIAVMAFVDPSVTLSGRSRPRVGMLVEDGPSMALPARAGGESRRMVAARVRQALHDRLDKDFDLVDETNGRTFVAIGDHYPDTHFSETARVSTVTVSAPLTPNVRIVAVDAPELVPRETAVRVSVALEATALPNTTTTLVVRTAGVEVGRLEHRWTPPSERWRGDVDVAPVGEPPFRFDVVAEPIAGEQTPADNAATITVDRAPALRVLVLEPRPSWASAFVRRALEDDSRFDVSSIVEPSPRGAVRTGDRPALDPNRLDAFDAILVGGLDRLSPATVTTLDRFLRGRGGAVALLPDGRVPDAIARTLLDGVRLHETLVDRPAALVSSVAPRLDASELLEATTLPAGARAIASAPASRQPVVWTIPRGRGHLLVSGAMDAWRFRAEPDAAFDRFWRSSVSGLALDAEPAVRVELVPRRAAPGERVRVVAHVRSLERDRLGERLAVAARVGSRDPIRLWPDAGAGDFTGSFVADAAHGESPLVTVTAGDDVTSGSARLAIDPHAREAIGPPLALAASTHGGINIGPDDLAVLERHLRATLPSTTTEAVRRPMRSVWWLLPFATCLSAEWWLRRRRGAR